MTSAPLALPSGAPPAAPPRVSLRVGAFVACLAGTMVLAGLIAAYLAVRTTTADFPPRGTNFDYYTATTLMLTLMLSAATLEWAAHAVRSELRGQATAAFALTLLLGLAHLNGLSFLLRGLRFGPGAHAYATLVHALMLTALVTALVGLGTLVLTTLRHVGHQLSPENYDLMRATAVVWHFVTLSWIAVYYVLYVTK